MLFRVYIRLFQFGDSKYSANISNVASGLQSFNYPIQLFSGDSATFWLAAHDTSGNITSTGAFNGNVIDVCWGNSGTDANSATTPAIELTVYYETATGNLLSNLSTIQVARWTSDPNTGRIATNVFGGVTSGTCPISGSTYPFYKRITFASYSPVANSNALILARVRMLYNNVPQSLAFDTSLSTTGTNQTLPSQGQNVTSTGTAGGSNREISVFQGWPEFPFDSNVVFSPASITK